jgi:hypothetical protein
MDTAEAWNGYLEAYRQLLRRRLLIRGCDKTLEDLVGTSLGKGGWERAAALDVVPLLSPAVQARVLPVIVRLATGDGDDAEGPRRVLRALPRSLVSEALAQVEALCCADEEHAKLRALRAALRPGEG